MPPSAETPERTALLTAVETLYATFERYPLRRVVKGCSHCVTAAQERTLHEFALREFPAEQLNYYAFKAMTTFGNAEDFKHFLPRLCEQAALGELRGSAASEEVLGVKIARAGYADWPQDERQALDGFALAWWHDVLARFPGYPDVAVVLCTIAQFTDLDPYLSYWRQTLTPSALGHLAVCTLTGWENAWWNGRSQQYQQVAAWYSDPITNESLTLAAYAFCDGTYPAASFSPWIENYFRELVAADSEKMLQR